MRNIKFYACLVFVMIALAGCRSGKAGKEPVINIPFAHTDVIDMEQFIESVRYVQLENHPESIFTDIDKLIVYDGMILMLDKRLEAVFCFDTTGRFRYRIQRVGRGPGEYQELDAMWINRAKKEVWLQSFWPPKIMVYNLNGQMLREFGTRWSARDMVGLNDGLIAAFNTTPSDDGSGRIDSGIFLLGQDGKFKRQAKVLGDSTIYWSLTQQRHLVEYDDGAYLLTQSDTVFKINRDGLVTPDFSIDWGKLKYPEELRGICYGTPGAKDALKGNYVNGKDQLVAFGPVRIFRIFLESHMEVAMADLRTGKGVFSTQLSCTVAPVPLLYPLAKSDRGELIGMYDMSLLQAMKESQAFRKPGAKSHNPYRAMDSLVESALLRDRPVLWFAKIKQEWLTKSL